MNVSFAFQINFLLHLNQLVAIDDANNMRKCLLLIGFILLFFSQFSLAGDRFTSLLYGHPMTEGHEHEFKPSTFNIKIQPAFFWNTLGVEAEFITSPSFSVCLNVLGKLSLEDIHLKNYPGRQQNYMQSGYLAEVIGRYYIPLSKKNLMLAPMGFYIQGSVGYSKLLYFDGAVRPFSLHTRSIQSTDPRTPNEFSQPSPVIAGVGAGYQLELVHNKVIATIYAAGQFNTDNRGIFFSAFVSPSIGMMF